MKLQRVLVVLIAVVVSVALLWRFAPGCRQQAASVYEKYGGWTDEARREDPVGFIDYAERKLRGHLNDMQQNARDLAAARERLKQESERNRAAVAAASQLAEAFRAAYRQAEAESSYPVLMEGRQYQRSELLEQVRLILRQRAHGGQAIGQLEQTVEDASRRESELLAQITSVKAALEMLPAQREIARASELTGQTERLWAQVNELIGRNETILTGSPVRTVDELLQDRMAESVSSEEVDVLGFLEGGE